MPDSSSAKRVLLDTNIFATIIEKTDVKNIENLKEKKIITVYGSDLIRKELRDIPKDIKYQGKSLRVLVLSFYDSIVKESFKTTGLIEELATQYFEVLRSLQPNTDKKIIKDLLIAATSSINEIEIVVSDDKKTMLSPNATKAYEIVSKIRKLRMPEFIGYEKFTRSFSL